MFVIPRSIRSAFKAGFAALLLLCAGWAQEAQALSISGPSAVDSGGSARFYAYNGSKEVNVTWYVYQWSSLLLSPVYGYYDTIKVTVTEDTYLSILAIHESGSYAMKTLLVRAPSAVSCRIEGSSSVAPGATEVYRSFVRFSDGTERQVSSDWYIRVEDVTQLALEDSNPVNWTGSLRNLTDISFTAIAVFTDTYGNTVLGEKDITILAWPLASLGISGPSAVPSNGEADYVAIGALSDGTQGEVPAAWSIVEGAAYGSIDGTGHFTAVSTREERRVVIQASYGGKTARTTVTVLPKTIVSLRVEGPTVLESGQEGGFSSIAVFDDGTEGTVSSLWTIVGPGSSGKTVGPCPAIGWTAPCIERDASYVVKAVCEGVSGSLSVLVRAETLVSVEIEGPGSVASRSRDVAYRCIATFSGGTTRTAVASWSISRGESYVEGMAEDPDVPAIFLDFVSTLYQLDNAVTLRASYSWGGRSQSATIAITIRHKTESRLAINGTDRIPAGDSAGYGATVFYDDGTSESVLPQEWSVDSTIDSISGGMLYTRRTNEGRIVTVSALYHGVWAVVPGRKTVRIVGRGTQDPDVEGMTILSLRVVHDHVRIPTPGSETFRAVATFVDGNGRTFERDVTALCDWDCPVRSDAEVSLLAGSILYARNYTAFTEQVCVRATYVDSADGRWSARGYVHVDPAPSQPPGPYHDPADVPHTVVEESATLDHLEIVGRDSVQALGQATYVCRAVYSDGTVVLANPAWSVSSSGGDTIGSSGILRASAASSDRRIMIQASFGGKTARLFVTVIGRRSLSSLSISGPASVRSGGTAFYSCVAHYDDGTADTVWASWAVVGGVQYGSIDASGTFTAAATDENGQVEIRATFGSRTVSKTVAIESSDAAQALVSVPIYRFYSKKYRGHFFTIDEGEKDDLVNKNPNWRYEGIAYYAFGEKGEGMVTLHRFYSKKYSGHFFTIDEEEMRRVRDTNPNWKYEGEAYYVYPDEVEGSVPVFRFWSKEYRHHFYTTNVDEKDDLIAHNPKWKYEGIAFYALEGETVAPAGRAAGSLSVSGPSSVPSGGTAAFVCTAVFNDGSAEDVKPAWSVVSGSAYASVDASGVLSAAVADQNRSVTVRATWNGLSADARLTIEARVPRAEEIGIDGEAYLSAGETTSLSCTVFYDDDTSETVSPEWRIVSGSDLGTLSASGVFKAATGTVGGPAAIEASWNGLVAEWTIWVDGARASFVSAGSVEAHLSTWTLSAADGAVVAVPGVTDVGGAIVETRGEAPDADELEAGGAGVPDAGELALRLTLPGGAFDASLWSASEGALAEEKPEGAFDFALPVSGVWHWLRVRDAEGEGGSSDAFSVWIRAE